MLESKKIIHASNLTVIGYCLLITSILLFIILSQHPFIVAEQVNEQLVEFKQKQQLFAWVHGSAIACLIVINVCLFCYSKQFKENKSALVFALLSFSFGTFSMIIAGLFSGFVMPFYVESMNVNNIGATSQFSQIWHFSLAINKAFAYLASLTWLAAIITWLYVLLRGEQSTIINLLSYALIISKSVFFIMLIFSFIHFNILAFVLFISMVIMFLFIISYLLINKGLCIFNTSCK